MASYMFSRQIEGDKDRISSVKHVQKSKIPVRRVTRLNNNSGKSSSSKEEADKKQRILRDSAEKPLESKPPSRIPIMVDQTNDTNSKIVRDKLPKSVRTATAKRPLGRESGINLREKQGKQTRGRIVRTANRPAAARHRNSEPSKESTSERRRMSIRKIAPLDVKQVSKDEKDPSTETPKAQDTSVQSEDLSSDCKLQNDHNQDDVIGQTKVSISEGDYAYLREEVELLKGSLDMCNYREELLRRQVDALKKAQAFKSDVEAANQRNEEGLKLEIEQIEKEHSEIVEELQQWVEDGNKENQTLEGIIEKNSGENVKLLAQISVMKKELKALAKENNALQTELATKTKDLKSLRFQVDILEAEISRFKASELKFKSPRDETSSLIYKPEAQRDTFMNESARKMSEKDQEKSTVVEQLNDRPSALMKEKNSITSENDEEKKELRDRKSKIIDQLNKRLVSYERKRHTDFREG